MQTDNAVIVCGLTKLNYELFELVFNESLKTVCM